MKFRCERDVLVEPWHRRPGVPAARGSACPCCPASARAAGDQLRLTGSDLDLTITGRAHRGRRRPTASPCCPPGCTTDIVRALEPGAVNVELDGDEARIASGRSQFTVRTYAGRRVPRACAEPGAATRVTLPAADFAEALRQVVRAASTDDARPILTGVLMAAESDGLRLVATDSYRLAVRDLPGTTVLAEGQKVLVPSRALTELGRLLARPRRGHAAPGRARRHLRGRVGSVRLTTRLIEGEFPNYRQLIPQHHPNRLTVGREPLLDAVRRVQLLARESATPVRLTMTADGLELTAITQDVGQAPRASTPSTRAPR